MRKVLGLQVLKDTKYLSVWTRCGFGLPMPNCNINRNEKKRAEQVLQTTVSLTSFELQMSTCNTNRNKKKACRAGVTDNGLIDIV